MLRRRLTRTTAAILLPLALALTACSDGEGAVEENVIAPGVTAVDAATAATCDADADVIRTAIGAFEATEGGVPESEAALVAAGYLPDESELFDVVDGRLEAVSNACKGSVPVTAPSGSAPLTAPATDLGQIVTEDDLLNADDVFATMTEDDITAFGGEACARELADIFAAGERYTAREGTEPEGLADLADDLEAPVELWVLDEAGRTLVPAEGSPCPDVFNESVTAG